MVITLQVVPQERRSLVHVKNQNVHVAVVVKISESTAATRMRSGDAWTCGFDLLKRSVSQISKENPRRLVGDLRKNLFHLGIYAAGYEEDVRPPIVVQIEDAVSPTGKAGLDAESCSVSDIVEVTLTVISIQDVVVIGKVGFENVEMPVCVVIPNPISHAGLFGSIVAQRDTPRDGLFNEGSVMLVHEEEAGSGVARHVNIGPAILVEVGGDDCHPVARPRLGNSSLNAHVREGAVAVVPVQGMHPERKTPRTTVDRNAFPVAIHRSTGPWHMLEIELQVV